MAIASIFAILVVVKEAKGERQYVHWNKHVRGNEQATKRSGDAY